MSIFRVDPRIRAYGKARIDVTRRAKDEQEWQRQWKQPRYPFPFTWGQGWKHSIQYQVTDFAAEVGFLIDVLGLPVYAFSPSSAIFTSPDQAFAFNVTAAPEHSAGTPPDAIRIQFMVKDLYTVIEELERRGVVFEQKPQPSNGQVDNQPSGYFRTPQGICIDLLGSASSPAQVAQAVFDPAEDGADKDFESRWQEMESTLTEAPSDEPVETTQMGQDNSGDSREIEMSDGDPIAELNLAAIQEPSKASQELFLSIDKESEGTGTDGETEGSNGSRGWSFTHTSAENSNRRADNRRSDVFPHTVRSHGSKNRGNGELRRFDPTRRTGAGRRKNPFSTQDLPPLPDLPSLRLSTPEKETPPAQQEPVPPEETPLLNSINQADVEKQNGKIGFRSEQGHPVEDEPRYEDLDDQASEELDDFYP